MGSLVESVFGSNKESQTGGSWSNNAWTPAMAGQYDQMINDIIQNGAPTGPGTAGLTDEAKAAIAGMGSGGTTAQYYQGILAGEGQEDRYNALLDQREASSASAANALEGALGNIGLGASSAGVGNSSRRGVAEGVATSQAQLGLAQQHAAQNQAFLDNEMSIRTNAANAMQGIYKDQLFGQGIIQQDNQQQMLDEWKKKYGQTSAGKMEFLLGMANNAAGLAGGHQSGTHNQSNEGFMGWFGK